MILKHDREEGRIRLSTKKLEPNPGDMIRNPELVFEKVFSLLVGVIFSGHFLYGCYSFLLLVFVHTQQTHLWYFSYYVSIMMNVFI